MSEESRGHVKPLNPRAPLVVDTRELGRRPGSMCKVSRSVPALTELAIDMIGVPQGVTIELDLRLEAVMEGVLVSGTAYLPLTGECVRCLDDFEDDLEVEFQELYVYPGEEGEDEEVFRLQGDLLDLEPVLRDAVVLALPLQPVCRDDCPGLCPQCGVRLADEPGHRHEVADSRWAALQGFVGGDAENSNDKLGARRAEKNQEK